MLFDVRFRPYPLPFWRGGSKRSPHQGPSLAIVTCLKNEGEDLVEWLCFHRQIGVTRFIIYDNLSTDATRQILGKVPFKEEIIVHRVSDEAAQKVAFRDAIRRYRHRLDWAAFIDGDELIVPLGGKSILEKLAELEAAGVSGFGIHWRVFGSAGHKERPPGLVTESFTRRAPDHFQVNEHIKPIVRMSDAKSMVTQHYIRVANRFLLDDGSEPAADFTGRAQQASFTQGFAIHHYITKSYAQCLRKISRGRPKPASSKEKYRPAIYWDAHNRNDLEDLRAAEVIAPIRDSVLQLRSELEQTNLVLS